MSIAVASTLALTVLAIRLAGSGYFRFGVQCNGQGSDDSLSTSMIAAANTNYDIVALYDGSTATIYVNGEQQASASKTFNFFTSPSKVTIGSGQLGGSSESFDFGTIKDVVVDAFQFPTTTISTSQATPTPPALPRPTLIPRPLLRMSS